MDFCLVLYHFDPERNGMKKRRFKVQRRLGMELPGLGKVGALARRPYPPGENGNKRRKYSDYALRMEEKQKVRAHYDLRERQLQRFIRVSKKGKKTNWVEALVGNLELRVDNVVFRLGLAPSIRSARQLCTHGHLLVNGKKVTSPSYILKKGDKISVREKSKDNQIVLRAKENPRMEVPSYLKGGKEEGEVIDVPNLENAPFQFDIGLFAEYYAARSV